MTLVLTSSRSTFGPNDPRKITYVSHGWAEESITNSLGLIIAARQERCGSVFLFYNCSDGQTVG
ncbi:hypothetical protein SERLA73DRAFT_183933 [Serpula lacrymans var. lacrymans S7.3]|uniref:Uncharacterized protein n=1 Tax=Serpula lacrymans var. lacrymans (strain S7.3) TaxID=936435 RepID=F8Q259_SERL3|nr:hypothetical protein SERLA73DRAFT_183933 [Serpula lacrymans var. lacrymans S7.3]